MKSLSDEAKKIKIRKDMHLSQADLLKGAAGRKLEEAQKIVPKIRLTPGTHE
jgi:hypothetical protein